MFTKLLTQLWSSRTRTIQHLSFFIFSLLISFHISAQTSPKVLQEWTALEEAEFLVDTSYQIVQCSPNSKAEILLNVFNESGMRTNFSIILHFSDGANNKKDVTINLELKHADMQIASCTDNKYPKLKFNVPEEIDVSSLQLTITYK